MNNCKTTYYLSSKYTQFGKVWMDVIKNVDGHDVSNYMCGYQTIKDFSRYLRKNGEKNFEVVRLFKKEMC